MPDAVGYRHKFGVIVPSTNTVVEHDYNMMGLPGVTFHAGRLTIAQPRLASNADFETLIDQIRGGISDAIQDVLTCKPDHLIMGMSAETFWGGAEGNARFEQSVRDEAGLEITTGATACSAALELHGARRIAVVTPYQPIADEQVRRFFADCGYEVVRLKGLRCPSATAIAEVCEPELLRALQELDGDDVHAIVQVGTNLSMVRLAAEAERWLAKPVLAINAATYWRALRSCGLRDQLRGFGTLLREH